MIPALILAASLLAAAPNDAAGGDAPQGDPAQTGAATVGEPLPPGAPTDSYELAAWCYGALNEYLIVYEKVIPDLKDIDRMFGTSVKEAKPYTSDMAAARVELKMLAGSVTAAEQASPEPITERGLAAIHKGAGIWSLAEAKTQRELARAWLEWALPDACDTNARELTKRSLLLGASLRYNAGQTPAPDAAAPHDAAPQAADTPPPAATPTPAPVKQEQPDAIDAFLGQQKQDGGGAAPGGAPQTDPGAAQPQP